MQGEAHRHETDGRNACHSCGKTIQSIQPVDGIGDTNKPDHRGQEADHVGQHHRFCAAGQPGEIDRTDLHPLRPDHHCNSHLTGKPRPGRE